MILKLELPSQYVVSRLLKATCPCDATWYPGKIQGKSQYLCTRENLARNCTSDIPSMQFILLPYSYLHTKISKNDTTLFQMYQSLTRLATLATFYQVSAFFSATISYKKVFQNSHKRTAHTHSDSKITLEDEALHGIAPINAAKRHLTRCRYPEQSVWFLHSITCLEQSKILVRTKLIKIKISIKLSFARTQKLYVTTGLADRQNYQTDVLQTWGNRDLLS